VPSLDAQIDDLYRRPLGEFVDARTALAKSLSGADAQRVRKLPKPTVVPWAVNQVYWRARPVYDRLIKSGDQLRRAQLAALQGKTADVRSAGDAHRRAIADAVTQAEAFAAADGSHPPPDALTRTFEALSLAPATVETPGRLTRPLQPAGFEALAGVKLKGTGLGRGPSETRPRLGRGPSETPPPTAAERRAAERAAQKEEAVRKKREAEIRKAEAAVERAKQRMRDAEAALRRTRDRSS
jgi:hypothetical protein